MLNKQGDDVTSQFQEGAEKALKLMQQHGIKSAILKSKSPSCGSDEVYDGTFTGTLKAGDGVTAALLKKEGMTVYTEKDFL